MKSIFLFLLISATLYIAHPESFPEPRSVKLMNDDTSGGTLGELAHTQDKVPTVEVTIAGAPEHLTWNTQFRYIINVVDPKDGESRFGEIDARACLMEIEYFPGGHKPEFNKVLNKNVEHKGLSLLKRSTCFGCHADKSRLAGPSFAEIAARYENNPATLNELGSHIINGSTGIWGSQVMPSHPDLKPEEAAQIVDYILKQGANRNKWIYPGLEGTFRTVDKENDEQGLYVLTASYTSTSEIRGEGSVVLKIK